jgi:iron(III) transport system permease protein
MTLFGSPAILALPAGFHTMTTKIWSLFQYPPKLELPRPPPCRCCC